MDTQSTTAPLIQYNESTTWSQPVYGAITLHRMLNHSMPSDEQVDELIKTLWRLSCDEPVSIEALRKTIREWTATL